MLTLISTMGTCLHYCLHVLLIVFTLYNILSGNITVFEGLAGIRGVLFCFVEGIIPLKYSNIFILIWKWIWASFFFSPILRFLQDTTIEEWMILVIERERETETKFKKKRCVVLWREGGFSKKMLCNEAISFCSFSMTFKPFDCCHPPLI